MHIRNLALDAARQHGLVAGRVLGVELVLIGVREQEEYEFGFSIRERNLYHLMRFYYGNGYPDASLQNALETLLEGAMRPGVDVLFHGHNRITG